MKKTFLFAAMCCFVINAWGIEYTPCQSTGFPNYFQSVYSYIDGTSKTKYVCFDDVFNPTLSFSSRIYDVCAFGYTGSTQMYKWHYDMSYYDCFDYGTYQNNTFTSTIIKKDGKVVSALGGGYSPDGHKGGWSSVPVGDIIDAAREMGYDRVVFAIRGLYALSEGSETVGYLNLGHVDVGYIECLSGISEPVYITDPHEITIDAREMWCDFKIDSNHGTSVNWERLANSYYSYRCIDDTVWIKDSYKKGITDVEVSSAKCVKGKKDGLYYVTGFTENTTITPVGKYSLLVKGEQVTFDNCGDILGDGTMSYNDATKTLTLNNANITYDNDVIKSTQDLTINCIGENTIASTGSNVATIFSSENLTITGTGSLLVQSTKAAGISTLPGLTIEGGCTVTVKSTRNTGVVTNALTVNNANLLANGNGTTPTISCGALTMTKTGILTGQTYDESRNKFLTAKGEEAQGQIVIGQIYDLSVCGNQVNYFNCNDVLGDGKVSYNSTTNTLTLNNATISCDGKNAISISESQPFTIECIGTNTITTTGNAVAVVNTGLGGTTFTGSGSVNMSSESPTYFGVMGLLKIQDGCSVTLQSSAGGCIGAGQLTVDDANLVAKGNGKVVTITCSGLTMENGVQIRSNHTYDATTHQFLNAAGEEAKDEIIIGVAGTGLEGLTVDNAQCTVKKMIIDNQLFIFREGRMYNAAGVLMK